MTKIALDPGQPPRVIARVRVDLGRADPGRQLRHPGAAGDHRRQLHPDHRRHALQAAAEAQGPQGPVPRIRPQPEPSPTCWRAAAPCWPGRSRRWTGSTGCCPTRTSDLLGRALRHPGGHRRAARTQGDHRRRPERAAERDRADPADFRAGHAGQGLVDGDGRRIMAKRNNAADEIEAASKDLRAMIGPGGAPTATSPPRACSRSPGRCQTAASGHNLDHSWLKDNKVAGLLTRTPSQEIEGKK